MKNPTVDIIIVDYNTGNLIKECLDSIAENKPQYAFMERVVIVDNASSDQGEQKYIQKELPLIVINNMENRGFAAACNQGAINSKADYLLFLNPDTRIKMDSLDKPIRFLEETYNKSIGIVGIQLLHQNGQVAHTCSYRVKFIHFINKIFALDKISKKRFPTGMMYEWDHATSRRVDGVMGAFYMVRRSLFEKLNGFDERFFVYYEETDFGFRSWQAGYETYYLAEASAYHQGHGSSKRIKAKRLYFSIRSRILYGYKHFKWLPATALLTITMIIEPLSRLSLACIRCSGSEIKNTIGGYRMLWKTLPDTLKKGRKNNRRYKTGENNEAE